MTREDDEAAVEAIMAMHAQGALTPEERDRMLDAHRRLIESMKKPHRQLDEEKAKLLAGRSGSKGDEG